MAGSLVHFELPSEDASRAKQFWSGVFGWTFNDPGRTQPIPHVGWFARCTDTEGNDFSLFQRDDSVSA